MNYIIIETFGGPEYAIIVTDTEGNNLIFDSRDEAEAEAADCQDGLIVEIRWNPKSPAVAPQQTGVAAAIKVLKGQLELLKKSW